LTHCSVCSIGRRGDDQSPRRARPAGAAAARYAMLQRTEPPPTFHGDVITRTPKSSATLTQR
jgi:hypothetical protein